MQGIFLASKNLSDLAKEYNEREREGEKERCVINKRRQRGLYNPPPSNHPNTNRKISLTWMKKKSGKGGEENKICGFGGLIYDPPGSD